MSASTNDGLMATKNSTVLGDFGRSVRDEPWHYIFKHRLYMMQNGIKAEPLVKWLRQRYARTKSGNRYRVCLYRAADGNRYVDYVLLETFKDDVRVEWRLRGWKWTTEKVKRGDRMPRIKLTKEQRKARDALVAKTLADFYASLQKS